MANTFKVKTDAGVTGLATTYTVPGSTTTIVVGMVVGNTTASGITTSVTLANSDGDDVELVTNAPIPVGSSLEVLSGAKVVLEASDAIKVTASGAADVALSILEMT